MAKTFSTSGFGEKFSSGAKPIINHDGTFNVTKIGSRKRTLYQRLVSFSWPRFLGFTLLFYLLVNVIFALTYYGIGPENLNGIPPGSAFSDFLYCFFFSVHTFTTVGYGHIAPMGMAANIVATIEALSGLMGFALITGLLYGRFSRPSTRIRFSKNFLIVPVNGQHELHFQLTNEREDLLIHPAVQVILKLNENTPDGPVRRFYELKLRISKIVFFPLNWRVVHEITPESPLYGISQEQLLESEAELLILMKAFDNVFRQEVYKWHGYIAHDAVFNARFAMPYRTDPSGETIMHLDEIDSFQKIDV
jgi:inward rectifier potassium channel